MRTNHTRTPKKGASITTMFLSNRVGTRNRYQIGYQISCSFQRTTISPCRPSQPGDSPTSDGGNRWFGAVLNSHPLDLISTVNGGFPNFGKPRKRSLNNMGIFRDKQISTSPTSPSSTSQISTSPCADLKIAYNNCFNRWYAEKFVKGQWEKEECVAEWEKYRECLAKHLKDKQLRRFLEAEASGMPPLADRVDAKS